MRSLLVRSFQRGRFLACRLGSGRHSRLGICRQGPHHDAHQMSRVDGHCHFRLVVPRLASDPVPCSRLIVFRLSLPRSRRRSSSFAFLRPLLFHCRALFLRFLFLPHSATASLRPPRCLPRHLSLSAHRFPTHFHSFLRRSFDHHHGLAGFCWSPRQDCTLRGSNLQLPDCFLGRDAWGPVATPHSPSTTQRSGTAIWTCCAGRCPGPCPGSTAAWS